MPSSKIPNTRDPAGPKVDQLKAFKKAARALDCDETEAAFDAALSKIARPKPKSEVVVDSDISARMSKIAQTED